MENRQINGEWVKLTKIALLCSSFVVTGQSFAEEGDVSTSQQDKQSVEIIDAERSDPFEGFNRTMWDFNQNYLDKYLARPAAIFYRDYIPVPAQSGIYNFASNFEEPSTMVNNALQGNVEDSSNAFGRFLINSTAGVFGIFDVAEKIGLKKKEDEFGEVLAVYGVDAGPYLMLPGLGPTTVRNFAGDRVDSLYFPLADMSTWQTVGLTVVKGIHVRAQLLEQEGLLNASLDQYAFVKEAYFQSRAYDIYDGDVPEAIDDTIEEDLDDEDLDD